VISLQSWMERIVYPIQTHESKNGSEKRRAVMKTNLIEGRNEDGGWLCDMYWIEGEWTGVHGIIGLAL